MKTFPIKSGGVIQFQKSVDGGFYMNVSHEPEFHLIHGDSVHLTRDELSSLCRYISDELNGQNPFNREDLLTALAVFAPNLHALINGSVEISEDKLALTRSFALEELIDYSESIHRNRLP